MVEPEAKSGSLAPFASELKPATRVLDGKNNSTNKSRSLHQPHLLHPPPHRVGTFLHLSPKTTVGPSHHAEMIPEMIAALEAELQRAHEELAEVKEQLVAAETGKAQALREFTNIKNLLDQISLVEHFAASDDVEVEAAPLPPNWSDGSSGQLDIANHKLEIDRLRNELEAARGLNSKFAAELDRANQEIDGVHHKSASLELENSRLETSRLQSELEAGRNHQGSICLELENAKKDILALQATLSDVWYHQDTSALELARAKEEIALLEADLEAAQNLTLELARAKDDINLLHEDLEHAWKSQETSSRQLREAQQEISSLRSQHVTSSSALASTTTRNTALQTELDSLRGLLETSTTELQTAKQDILSLLAEYETKSSEAVREAANAKEEIRRLQGELTAALTKGRESATMLRASEEEVDELQKKLEGVIGQYYNTCNERSEAREQLETVRVKYERCSSELFNVKEDIFRQEVEHLASHEDLMTDITIAQDENLKLQAEVAALKDEKISLSVELAKGRDEVHRLQVELEGAGKRHYSACNELFRDIARLQSELGALQGQLGDRCRELEEVSTSFQSQLTQVQELHDTVMSELSNANDKVRVLQLDATKEFERSVEVVRALKEEIRNVQSDLAMQYSSSVLEKSLTEKRMQELSLELRDAKECLQAAIAAQTRAETELAATTKETEVVASALRADLAAVQAELAAAREAESKLDVMTEVMTLEMEDLRAQMAFNKQTMATALASELGAAMDALHAELDAVKTSEAKYREKVMSSQAQIEDLQTQLNALRDSEAKAKECLVSTSSELQKKEVELAIAKEAIEWVSGDAAALSAELEAKKAEVVSTKEGEARAKAAYTDYSLKLQKMRLALEDASKLADKARTFELDLDDVTAKLEKVTESEMTMSASMASLKAELNNAKTELAATREDHGIALAEKEQQCELELNQMRTQWEVAVISEATLTDANFALNESLIKVMAEAEEASFAVGQATQEAEKAMQEVEELQTHIETLEAKLEMLQLEVEAAKASEEWAFAQMRLKTIPEHDVETEEAAEAPVSFEEYQSLKTKAKELQELVDKRGAVGVAEARAAKASEREMQRRIQSLEKELRSCRNELSEAISKREEAEAAKFSCEAALRAKRLERKSLSHSGYLNGGHSTGKLMNAGDRQGSLNGICFEDSQSSSSPSRSSFSFASFASPGRSERSPMQSISQVLTTTSRVPSEEKQRKLKLSSKIGAYFSKKKLLV